MTSLAPPICVGCRHLHNGGMLFPKAQCDAFPDKIPSDILLSEFDHRHAHDGDSGIRFSPKDASDTQYADRLFGTTPAH